MNVRMFPPNNISGQTQTVNGRVYTAVPGNYLDVNLADAFVLVSNGWTRACNTGATSDRPSSTLPPDLYEKSRPFFDQTLSKIVIFDGQTWRDPATGAAA